MKLYGRQWTRRELEARTGRIEQLGGIRRFKLVEGLEAEAELIQVRTGAGLAYYANPSHALDLSLAEFNGYPLSWQGPAGDTHPAYFNPEGLEWLRTAAGGLLMTCGFDQVGGPCEEGNERLGLHGRAHHLPARHVSTSGTWRGDEYEMEASGLVEQTRIFGEHLEFRRRLVSRMGANVIEIHDSIRNAGFQAVPHMLLYHVNLGFPLMMPETQVQIPSTRVIPRDADVSTDGFERWQPPDPEYAERVYYHEDFEVDSESRTCTALVVNPHFPTADGERTVPLEFRITWNTGQLPRMVQWKMPGAGVHVLGMEPANCHAEGRAADRARGELEMLEPGESRSYDLELEVFVE